jgi:nucleotide-binding universal stress UspA family protein
MGEPDRPLLLCFDGTDPAAFAVHAAAGLLQPRRAVVAAVWQPLHHGATTGEELDAGPLARWQTARADHAAGLAAAGTAIAQAAGLAAEPRALAGDDVGAALVALARDIDAAAIVAGGRRTSARHPHVLASVTRAIAHGTDRPILLTHGVEASADADGPVLLAYDGSDAARDAITASAPLFGGGRAVVVHAWLAPSHLLLWNPLIKGPGPLAEPAAMLDEASAEAARDRAQEGADHARAAGYDAESAAEPITHGTWRTLLRAAREHRARAIVTGSHGWSPVDTALGTVADRITTHADRPVLMVPSGSHAAHGPRP